MEYPTDHSEERLQDEIDHEEDECAHCNGSGVEPDAEDFRDCVCCSGSGYYGT